MNTHTRARSSAWTGRAPRTVTEAFGPHASGLRGEREAAHDRQDVIVMCACAVAVVALLGMAALRWI